MTTAFQSTAFQNDAFQIDDGAVVQPPASPRGSGRLTKAWRERSSGIYWPKKISKKAVIEVIEAVAEENPTVAELPVGALADRVLQLYTPGIIRAFQEREQFLACSSIPKFRGCISTSRSEIFAIRTEGDTKYTAIVAG